MRRKAICAVMLVLLLALCSACQEDPQLPEGPSIAPIADENGKLPKHVTRELNENIRLDADIEVPEGYDLNNGRVLSAEAVPFDRDAMYERYLGDKKNVTFYEECKPYSDYDLTQTTYGFGEDGSGSCYLFDKANFAFQLDNFKDPSTSFDSLRRGRDNGWDPIDFPTEGDLDFMPQKEAVRLVQNAVEDIGGKDTELMVCYVATKEELNEWWPPVVPEDPKFEDEGYYICLRHHIEDLPVATDIKQRKSEGKSNFLCSYVTAYVTETGIASIDIANLIRQTGVRREEVPLVSLEQAVSVVAETFRELALNDDAVKPYIVSEIRLEYVPFYEDREFSSIELRPCWNFALEYQTRFGDANTPRSDTVYIDYCTVDAVTGLKL